MTLRVRLVAALLVLVTAGLAVFGFATYRLFDRSQRQKLDDQLAATAPTMAAQLGVEGTQGGPRPGDPGFGSGTASTTTQPADGDDQGEGPPQEVVGVDTYGELRTPDGRLTGTRQKVPGSSSRPELPSVLTAGDDDGRYLTVGSAVGSGDWRVYVAPARGPRRLSVVVALPVASATGPVHRLVQFEVAAGIGLLLVLGGGATLIMRQGLRPLERMAGTARTIAAGDLSQRVTPSEGRTEIGQLGLALNTMLDDIEEAFREREATEARLRQFLADASHELRTPLTSIQGFAELFRLGATDGGNEHVDLPVILRRIEQESARMKALVEDLLLLARIDQTRPIERNPVDLAVLAADACSDAVAADPTRPVTLDAPEPVVVAADADHLRQAVANLVANAVRHTPEGTPVEVGAHVRGGVAELTVRDRGPGLDDEALAHVFDRFWQADSARAGSGVGLGLAIVAGIATEHGGTVAATNAPDGGAVFTIRLPMTGPVGDAGPAFRSRPAAEATDGQSRSPSPG